MAGLFFRNPRTGEVSEVIVSMERTEAIRAERKAGGWEEIGSLAYEIAQLTSRYGRQEVAEAARWPAKTRLYMVADRADLDAILPHLLAGHWFVLDPLPDDAWYLEVKDEPLGAELSAALAAHAAREK